MKHIIQKFKISELAFLFFVFLIPFQLRTILNLDSAYLGYYFSYHQAIFLYASDVAFLAFLFVWFIYDRETEKSDRIYILGLLGGLIALFHVEQWDLWVYNLAKISQFLAILLFLKHNPRVFKPLIYLIFVSGLIQASIGIAQFHTQANVGLIYLGEYVPLVTDSGSATIVSEGQKLLRAYGTMPHPNVLGGFLAISLAFALYVSRETQGIYPRIIVSCGTILLIWGLILTFSRSAWLAGILSVSIFLISDWRNKWPKYAIISWIIVIVSCGTLVFAYKNQVFQRSTDVLSISQAASYRSDFNAIGLEIVKQHPITGIGLGQYVSYLSRTYNLEPWANQPPHNAFILILAEIGLFGTFLWFGMLYKLGFTWNNSIKTPLNSLYYALIGGILILASLDHYLVTIQQGRLLLGLCLAVVLLIIKNVSQAVKHFSDVKQ